MSRSAYASLSYVPAVTPAPAPKKKVQVQADFGLCFICKTSGAGLGYSPNSYRPTKWVCETCPPLAKRCYHMTPKGFDKFEETAINTGGEALGAYLDSIGETDLAKLTPQQFQEALLCFMHTYVTTMRLQADSFAPPF